MSKSSLSRTELPYEATPFERFLLKWKYWLMLASFVVVFLFTFVTGSYYGMRGGIQEARQSSIMQTAHAIGLAMYSYANDHDGKYPQGKSSTEVFQKLVDGGYITDPTIFYFRMKGKTKAEGKKLKPENVCWDVTDSLSFNDPDALPLLCSTGYKIDYVAGGKAHLLANGDPDGIAVAGLVVFYKSNAAIFKVAATGGIPLIDASFDPQGRTYRQLTPDGVLP